MSRVRHLLAAVVLVSCAVTALPAQPTAAQLSLNGVRRVNLRFILTADDIQAGVDTARLRGVVEGRLKSRGIGLVPGRSGGDGTLGVNVGAIRSATGTNVTFFLYLDFRQQVKVARLPDPPYPPVPGITWTSPVSFGTRATAEILPYLDEATGELLDGFLSDHAAGQR